MLACVCECVCVCAPIRESLSVVESHVLFRRARHGVVVLGNSHRLFKWTKEICPGKRGTATSGSRKCLHLAKRVEVGRAASHVALESRSRGEVPRPELVGTCRAYASSRDQSVQRSSCSEDRKPKRIRRKAWLQHAHLTHPRVSPSPHWEMDIREESTRE